MPTGRPRSFDAKKALDQALKVFWRKGYEGASLSDLTEAMGINRPSMYAAFGNKEELFRKALDRYAEGPACHVREALAQPTARKVAEQLLFAGIELVTDPRNPRGCLMVQGALACGDTADTVQREMIKRRAATEEALRMRFEQSIRDRDLPRGASASKLAKFVVTIMHGMAVQAASGATREELKSVAELAMRAFPESATAKTVRRKAKR
jgi:AcrR family transcriptional regulator